MKLSSTYRLVSDRSNLRSGSIFSAQDEVAAKVIGAVRLGLVDIKEVIRELNTEDMQRVPEIHLLLHESLLHTCMPSVSSKFAVEKSKLRSTSKVCETFIIQLFECN